MYYAFVNGKLIDRGGIIDVRQSIVEVIYRRRKTGTICSDMAGKNVVEHIRNGNVDRDSSPIMSRKVGERKWRAVSADGEIFVETKNGGRFYERK